MPSIPGRPPGNGQLRGLSGSVSPDHDNCAADQLLICAASRAKADRRPNRGRAPVQARSRAGDGIGKRGIERLAQRGIVVLFAHFAACSPRQWSLAIAAPGRDGLMDASWRGGLMATDGGDPGRKSMGWPAPDGAYCPPPRRGCAMAAQAFIPGRAFALLFCPQDFRQSGGPCLLPERHDSSTGIFSALRPCRIPGEQEAVVDQVVRPGLLVLMPTGGGNAVLPGAGAASPVPRSSSRADCANAGQVEAGTLGVAPRS